MVEPEFAEMTDEENYRSPCDDCDYPCDIWEARYCCTLCQFYGYDYDCSECFDDYMDI